MADITKCSGKDCHFKDKCYRFTSSESEYRQSFFTDAPIKDGKCDMYWGENSESTFNKLKEIMRTSATDRSDLS